MSEIVLNFCFVQIHQIQGAMTITSRYKETD